MTAPTVLRRLMKSKASDQFSAHRTSMRTEASQERSLRPLTCPRAVMPGFTRKRVQVEAVALDPVGSGGRRLTSDMSPRTTLSRCGSSSSE